MALFQSIFQKFTIKCNKEKRLFVIIYPSGLHLGIILTPGTLVAMSGDMFYGHTW